jgi:hypothetical protein
VVEHCLHTAGAVGSNPTARTISPKSAKSSRSGHFLFASRWLSRRPEPVEGQSRHHRYDVINSSHPEGVTAMPSTFLSLHFHLVWSTKDRTPFIHAEWRDRLHHYLGGVVNGLLTEHRWSPICRLSSGKLPADNASCIANHEDSKGFNKVSLRVFKPSWFLGSSDTWREADVGNNGLEPPHVGSYGFKAAPFRCS